jgi:hypothetical protein
MAKHPSTYQNGKVILLHCGTNDIPKTPIKDFIPKFKRLVDLIRINAPQIVIIVSAVLPRLRDDAIFYEKIKEVNFQVKKSCEEWRVWFVPSNRLMLRNGKPIVDYYYDGLHLNNHGIIRLKQYFSQKLSELGGKPTSVNSTTSYQKRSEWKAAKSVK